MIKQNFSNLVIPPPPPVIGRDEPNSRQRLFNFIIAQIIQNVDNNLQNCEKCSCAQQPLWQSLLTKSRQTQDDRNIPLKKHYKIPFMRRCIAVIPLSNQSRLKVYSETRDNFFVTNSVKLSLASLAYKRLLSLFEIFLLSVL